MVLYGIAFWEIQWITLSEQRGHFRAFVNGVVSTSFHKKGKLCIAYFLSNSLTVTTDHAVVSFVILFVSKLSTDWCSVHRPVHTADSVFL